ncbi:MAG: hypothetical protein GY816_02790 [Cytophagales bacterium]|nr:hypothetical protein [Cytophagales bacterium]
MCKVIGSTVGWEASQSEQHQIEMDDSTENFPNLGGDNIFEGEEETSGESSEDESVEDEPKRKRPKIIEKGPLYSQKHPRQTVYKVWKLKCKQHYNMAILFLL